MAALKYGSRKFYEIPSDEYSQESHADKSKKDQPDNGLLDYINDNCIGKHTTFSGPFGTRKAVYCDYTASGRSLSFIEDYIREQVLPHYGNTHTTTTVTSLQTTMYRHEARDIIRNAVNAGEGDAVVFTGSGCTAAVHKLIHALDLKEPPVVFVGPYEHHSNLLPWRELGSQMVWIEQDSNGLVDMQDLENKLKEHATDGKQMIGCFAAASNVTGILADTNAITACLHRHSALALWDYATAGPYVEINMNPLVANEDQALIYKDAVFISPHKFIGGVGTPGILVAKKTLFKNPVPSGCGGGSVFFVTNDTHRYLKETEMREEGGTPSIVESIRAGLVFQLKEVIGTDVIMKKEEELYRKAILAWSNQEALILLGNTLVPRLPVFSFLIRHPGSGLFLHHNYVCALLNDLFGIQARGGCACAGPYAQDLLGIDDNLAQEIEALLLEDSRLDRLHLRRYHEYSEREVLRPGFVRLNLPYFMSDEEVRFVLRAVQMVTEHGWKLLPQYMFNPETGEWRHRRHQVFRDRKWLGSISYASGHMTYPSAPALADEAPKTLEECLSRAEEIFSKASKTKLSSSVADQTLLLGDTGEDMRWFILPSEAADLMAGKPQARFPTSPPFMPRVWNSPERSSAGDIEKGPPGKEPYELTSKVSLEEKIATSAETRMSVRPMVKERCCHKPVDAKVVCDKSDEVIEREQLLVRSELKCKTNACQEETSTLSHSGNQVRDDEASAKESVSSSCDNCKHFSSDNHLESSEQATNEPDKSCVHHSTTQRSLQTGETKKGSECQEQEVDECAKKCAPCSKTQDAVQVSLSGSVQQSSVNYDGGKEMRSGLDRKGCDVVAKEGVPSVVCKRKSNIQERVGKPRFHNPPKSIFKPTVQAIEDYNMIKDGDRVMVCLSGGKDSLSLLHTLRQYQFLAKSKGISFELGAATVDPQSIAYDPRPLVHYLAALGVPYFYEEQGIIQQAAQLPACESICSFCSRMKRGRLYACARRERYNVLAMGQHLDDLAESFVMSAFHNGLLRTMKANYTVQEGDLRLIRPLVYVREKELRTFAEKSRLPVIAENCPACFEAPKERHRTKQLLAAQELLFPGLFNSLLTAMRPLMARDRVGMESSKMKTGNYEDFA